MRRLIRTLSTLFATLLLATALVPSASAGSSLGDAFKKVLESTQRLQKSQRKLVDSKKRYDDKMKELVAMAGDVFKILTKKTPAATPRKAAVAPWQQIAVTPKEVLQRPNPFSALTPIKPVRANLLSALKPLKPVKTNLLSALKPLKPVKTNLLSALKPLKPVKTNLLSALKPLKAATPAWSPMPVSILESLRRQRVRRILASLQLPTATSPAPRLASLRLAPAKPTITPSTTPTADSLRLFRPQGTDLFDRLSFNNP